MLSIKNLNVWVSEKHIINNLNLDIPMGEIHALMGPNGVGKSTICKSILKSPNYKISE